MERRDKTVERGETIRCREAEQKLPGEWEGREGGEQSYELMIERKY